MRNIRDRLKSNRNCGLLPGFSKGVITIYTCVMVLILMSTLLAYATRSSLYEQRRSADEYRQKQAFHAAQAGIELGTEWFMANTSLINTELGDVVGSQDGFFFPGAERWTQCGSVDYQSDKSHPCWGDPNDSRRPYVYFYNHSGSTHLPVDGSALAGGSDVEVEALLCFVFIEDAIILPGLTSEILGCQLLDGLVVDSSKFMITLLSRGLADCVGDDCKAEGLISQAVTNFTISSHASTPAVPLVSNGPLPSTGLLQLAANDNNPSSPMTVWGNMNQTCGGGGFEFAASSLLSCPASLLESEGGNCPSPSGVLEILLATINGEVLSATGGLVGLMNAIVGTGSDLLGDPDFPCDLYATYFGVAKQNWDVVRDSVTVLNDCSLLDGDSHGTFWLSTDNCELMGQVGSEANPVMLISAAENTSLASNVHLYGTLFVTDVESAQSSLSAGDGVVVHGQLVSESAWGMINGTMTVIYDEELIVNSMLSASLGSVHGTWADFHKEWE